MRKVVVYMLLSVDGVATAPEEYFLDYWDAEMDANLAATIGTQTDVILGRRSYDEWSGYWPTSDVEPFASFINAVPKHVATSTPLTQEWVPASVIEGDLLEFVRELKSGEGGDIGVHASITVARALLSGGAVDELRLVVAPVIAGSGRRFLDDLPSTRLEMISSETSPGGFLLATYGVLAG
jgi:dihydrofolate reductase